MTDHPTLGDIVRAQQRLKDHLRPTPLEDAADLGTGTFLKLENANRTHSFKIRGALNAMLSLNEEGAGPGHRRRVFGQFRDGGRLRRASVRSIGTDSDARRNAEEEGERSTPLRRRCRRSGALR